MQEAVDGSFSSIELWRFACEGYLGALTRRHEEEAATLEATLKATVDGEEIPFRMLRPTIANSADRDRRERIERVRNELTEEHLNPILLASHQETHEATRELGADELPRALRQVRLPLDDLAAQCRAFLDSTESLYEDAADRMLRASVGVGLAEAQRWDVARVFRATKWDPVVPRRQDAPRARGDAPGPRHRPARAGERPPRRRGAAAQDARGRSAAPIEVPGQGHARHPADRRARRLARALPRGRPHRALREHARRAHGRGAPARRQRRHRGLGDAHGAPDRTTRRGSRAASTSRGPRSSRPRAPRSSSSSSGATARSSSTSSSSTSRTTSTAMRPRYVEICSATR